MCSVFEVLDLDFVCYKNMSEDVVFDVVEQILVKLDVIDLIRCKNVCKSWRSLISSHRFIKAHLNHTYNNDNKQVGHRRMIMSGIQHPMKISQESLYYLDSNHIVGSSNGLHIS